MTQTFGQQLHAFSLAVDIVSDEVLKRVLESVTDYFERELSIHFFEVLIATDIGRDKPRRGLRSAWHPGGKEWSETVRAEDGSYNGQVSYCFDKRCELWIVAEGGPLEKAGGFENLLRTHDLEPDFPPFKDLTPAETRTSIMWPMRVGADVIGLINLESPELLKPTDTLRNEVLTIAESIAHLHVLKQTTALQTDNTRKALKNLTDQSSLALPHRRRAFIASAVQADRGVVEIIRTVVRGTELEEKYWADETESGNITEHIWKNISTAEIGICYLSEPMHGDQKYRDNQNVLFEAGMMHALTHSAHVMRAWIPVREKDSAPAPFDFSTERMLLVPRTAGGRLDELEFERNIRRRLSHLLTDDGV